MDEAAKRKKEDEADLKKKPDEDKKDEDADLEKKPEEDRDATKEKKPEEDKKDEVDREKEPSKISKEDAESIEAGVKYDKRRDDVSSIATTEDSKGSKKVSINEDDLIDDEDAKTHKWSAKARKFSLKTEQSEIAIPVGKKSMAKSDRTKSRGSIKQASTIDSSQQSPDTSSGNDEEEGGDDFGQSQAQAAKAVEDEIRERRGSWADDVEDEEVAEEEANEGGMSDLLDRSKNAEQQMADKDQQKGRRKRRETLKKDKRDKKDKKKGDHEKAKPKARVEEKFVEPNYDSSEFISEPHYSSDTSITENILKFYHSYGYDFTRRNNINMLDSDTLAFINGNYIHFYSLSENKLKSLRRSAIGSGLGHIAVHPSYAYFAVGEKGANPCVVIYKWPALELHRILRRGTTRGYAFLNFNTTGELLCSQGIEPDYMLTIWDWAKEKIVLRCKAFSQDVFQANFSPINPGDLTTCGVGHLRFWKMAETFTGLKLQGAIGRFGKTEISDIQGYASIGGGKIISGCEWGNILVWDGGLIVVELTNAGGKTCHNGEITVMRVQETPELLTIGMDGYVKLWELDTVEIADTVVGDSGKFEIEPIHELKLSSLAKPVSAIKCLHEKDNIWFVQDSWGKIWNVNITQSISNHEYKANTVFYCPGGGINAVATSPTYTMMVVGTTMGHLWLMEYINKECIARKAYEEAITKILWLPTRYDPNGITFLVGFNDGNLRVLSVNKRTDKEKEAPGGDLGVGDDEEYKLPYALVLLDRLRVHKGAFLVLKLDEDNDILYCCGEDRLIFAISVFWDDETNAVGLYPLSYVTAPFPVCSVDLHPFKDYRMIIASKGGRVAECRKPDWSNVDTSISYNNGKLHGRRWMYTSVKSQQRREERRVQRKAERDRKYIELLKDIKAKRDAGAVVEEEQEVARLNDYYRRAQQQDDDEPLYIPEKPCPVLAIYYHINKNVAEPSAGKSFFLHVGGYDAGYIYECNCLRPKAAGFHVVPPAPPFKEDVAIHSYIVSDDDEFLIFGMGDGTIRVISSYDPDILEERIRLKEKESDLPTDPSPDSGSENESDSGTPPTASEAIESVEGSKKTNSKKAAFQPSIFPYDLNDYMSMPMHDPDRGIVTDLAWSFDYEFLFSVGADGTIFSYRWDPAGNLRSADDNLTAPNVPKESQAAVSIVNDSEDSTALTLEEQKKKDEDDRIFNAAEEKKEVIRKELRKMKLEYKKIKIANNNIPDKYRLSKECFKLDQRIYEIYREQTKKEVEKVYQKFEYESAKSIALVEKIHKNFLDEIETPHIIVKDISHTIQVHTIRNRYLSTEFRVVLQNNKALIDKESTIIKAGDESDIKEEKVEVPPVKRVYAKDLIGNYEGKEYKINTIHAIRNLEKRLEKKYKRENKLRDLEIEKIADDYVAPEDVQALEIAKATTGDYKLKTSKDYLGEQISVAVRRQRVLDLKLEMYTMISTFNKNVVDLRNEKYFVVKECRKKEEQLRRLRKLIPKELRKPIPRVFDVEACEEPEKRFEITPAQIAERQKKKLIAAGLFDKKGQIMDEMRGAIKHVDFTKKTAPKNKKQEIVKRKQGPQRQQGYTQTTRATRSEELEDESMSTHKYRKCVFNPKTAVARQRYELLISQRCFEQDNLLNELNKIIAYYKERVRLLGDDRIMIQLDLKLMSLRLMNMVAELQIVKDFESEENSVMDRLRAQKVECLAAKDRLEKAKRKLAKAKLEQQKMEESIAVAQKEVAVVIAEKPKHADYLWKVYRKKIRIETQGDELDEGDEDRFVSHPGSEQSSESGSTNSTSQDSSSDLFKMPKQKLDVNICPENLDRDLYSRVCDLREKKAHLEMDVEGKKKIVDHIISDCNEIEKIYNKYEARLADIGQEVAVVQRRKQERMNDLMALCVLKADQIQCLDEEEMERTKGSYLQRVRRSFPGHHELIVFPKNGITKLDLRAEELKDEAAHERDKYKKTRHMLSRLQEELKKMESKVRLLNIKLKEEMLLKFSQIIDIDYVSAAIINLELLDLQLKVEQDRNIQYKQQGIVLKALEKEKRTLTDITKENSDCNVLMAKVIERERDVDYYLYKKSKEKAKEAAAPDNQGGRAMTSLNTFNSASSYRTNDDIYIEMDRLEILLNQLRDRILYLRRTIDAFQKKDGIPEKPILEDMPEARNMLMQVRAIEAKYNAELQYLYKSCGGAQGDLAPVDIKSSTAPASWVPEVPSTPHEEHLHHHHHRDHSVHTGTSLYNPADYSGQILELFSAENKEQAEDLMNPDEDNDIETKKEGSYFLINELLDDQMPTAEETEIHWSHHEPSYDKDPLLTAESVPQEVPDQPARDETALETEIIPENTENGQAKVEKKDTEERLK